MTDASLTVNGTAHFGWQEVGVTRSMEQLAHSFDVGFVEKWSEKTDAIPILEGDACIFKLDGEVIATGYVDDSNPSYNAGDNTMHVTGRSKTGDLVDCSAIYKTGHWRKQDLLTIANNLCEPFGISASVASGVSVGEKFSWFALQDGESVFDALERGCRQRGLIMATTPTGNLVFAKVGVSETKTTIEYGKNVIAGARTGSWKDRHSKYIVKGQSPGNDDLSGSATTQPKAISLDGVVTRYRPLIVHAETQAHGTGLQKRADWERNVRAGRSARLKYTLDGWENNEGLWEPNTLVRVIDRRFQVDTQLLVISARQSKGANGSNTDIEVADAKSMTVEPLTQQAKGKAKQRDYMRGSK